MDARLQKIRSQWPDARLLSLRGVPQDSNPNAIFQCVVGADPSKTHKYVAWTLKAWENNGLQFEDIETGSESKTAETLSEFERFKNRIGNPRFENQNTGLSLRDAKDRSLLRYKEPGELYKAVRPWVIAEQEYGETASSKEQKRLDMMKARLESYSITTESGLKIDIPATIFAARKLGQQTKWCTSALNNNMFKSYAEKGELYIITLPTGEKFQAHSDINVYDDDDDSEINEDDIDWNGDEDDEPEDTGVDYTKSSLVAFLEYIRLKNEEDLFNKTREEGVPFHDQDTIGYIISSIANRMDFMDETDSPVTKKSGEPLIPYNREIGISLADYILRSIMAKADTRTIHQDFIDEFRQDLQEKIISRLNEDCKRGYHDLTPQEREDKTNQYFQEKEDQLAQAKALPHRNLFDKLSQDGAFIGGKDDLTLNIPDGMTLDDYIKKYASAIQPEGSSPIEKIVWDNEMTKLCHDILDKVKVSKELANTFYKSCDKYKRNPFTIESETATDVAARDLFSILTGLVAKQRFEEPGYINNRDDAMGILADIKSAERYTQYSASILQHYAPTSFLKEWLEKEPSKDATPLASTLMERMKKAGHSSIKTFEEVFKMDTTNMNMESADGEEHTPEHRIDVISKQIKHIAVNHIQMYLARPKTTVNAENTKRIRNAINQVIDNHIPAMSQKERSSLFRDIFEDAFSSRYSYQSSLPDKDYKIFFDGLVGAYPNDYVSRITSALDSGVITEVDSDILSDMKIHGKKVGLRYEDFPERYQDALCLLSNIREDKGVHYDEMGSQTTQRAGDVCHIEATDKTQVLSPIVTISSCISNPTRDFLCRVEEEKTKLWEQKTPLTLEQQYSLKCLHIQALQIEDIANTRIHHVIGLLKDNDIISVDEAEAMMDEKPMNTRAIKWLESDLEKLIKSKKSMDNSIS